MDLMQILGLIVAVLLGLGIGFCVMQSWTSLVLAIITLIGFVRGKRERSYTALAFGTALIHAIVFSGILFLIDEAAMELDRNRYLTMVRSAPPQLQGLPWPDP
jgi:predicted membrane protein